MIHNSKFKIQKLSKRLFIIIVTLVVIGVPLAYLSILNAPAAKAAWFDNNWAYRKAITVTVTSSSSDITNLETLLTVDTSTNLSGKIQSACQDLRFTSVSGKQLPYYIDSGCTGTTSKIWVMADLVPKNTTTYTMYMYYGNPAATAGTDANTFWRVKNLVGYWTMNESSWNGTSGEVKNSSVNANNGTGNGGVTTTSGKYSNAGNFDGTDDYVSTTYTKTSGDGTWSIWFKTSSQTSDTGSVWRPFMQQGLNDGNPTTQGIHMKMGRQGFANYGQISFNWGSNTDPQILSPSTYLDGLWHNAVMTHTGTSYTVYIDGVTIGTGVAVDAVDTSTVLQIGGSTTAAARKFLGVVDDARVYDRALSDTEVLNLYIDPGTIATTATTTSNPSTSFATEETSPGPVAWWKFDEGFGTTANDSGSSKAYGTLSGSTVPAWKSEDQCVSGKCLYFDGSTSYVGVGTTAVNAKSVAMWVKPSSVSSPALIDLDGGVHTITVSSGTISANGFSSATVYVNGVVSSTLTANSWQYVTITTATGFNATSVTIGKSSSTYFTGFIDDVKFYNYARDGTQVKADYNSRGGVTGAAANLGNIAANTGVGNSGPIGYWNFDENTGTSVNDRSSNGYTGSWNDFYASDHFTRTDSSSSLGTSETTQAWSALTGTWGIRSNQAYQAGLSASTNFAVVDSGTANGDIFLTIQRRNGSVGMTFRATNSSNLFYITTNGAGGSLHKINAGSDTTVTPTSGSIPAQASDNSAHTWKVNLNGSAITVYVDNVQKATYSDSFNSTATKHGLYDNNSNATDNSYDNFFVKNPVPNGNWTAGKFGGAGNFNYNPLFFSNTAVSNSISGVKSVSFWVNPASTSVNIMALASGVYITSSGGTISATGFTSPTIYVNGVVNGVLTAKTWNHVEVTSGTAVTANTVTFGYANLAFLTGKLDQIAFYNYARTQQQVVQDVNGGHPPPGSPVSSAIGYWKFDEGFGTNANSIGIGATGLNSSTLNGTLSGFSSPSTSTSGWTNAGKFGKGLLFDGSNDYVFVRDSPALSPSTGVTVSAWINVTSYNASTWNMIATKWADGPSRYQFHFSLHQGKLSIFASTDGTTVGSELAVDSNTITTGVWHYVAFTLDTTSRQVKLYMDGIQVGSTGTFGASTLPSTTAQFQIGEKDGTGHGSFPFNGSIDEVKFYNYALTSDQIKLDMNKQSAQYFGSIQNSSGYQPNATNQIYCSPGESSCTPPSAEFLFEDNKGTVAKDTSGTDATATLTSSPTWVAGKYGSALRFNGSSYVALSQGSVGSSTFEPLGNTYSIEAWVKTGSSNLKQVVVNLGSTASDRILISVGDGTTAGIPNCEIAVGGTGATFQGSTAINDNKWHHIACVRTSTGQQGTLYVDGVSVGSSTSGTGSSINGFNSGRIGIDADGANGFVGIIDNVTFYNNTIRSASEINWDATKGKPIAYWKFDECQGDRANDSSGNGNNETITVGASGTYTSVGTCASSSASTMWYNGATGKYNSSLAFDGTDSYINTTYTKTSGDGTFAVWFKGGTQSSGSSSVVRPIVIQGNFDAAGGTYPEGILINMFRNGHASHGKLSFEWGEESAAGSVTTTQTYNDSNWHHAVLTKSGTTATAYVDGVLIGSFTAVDAVDTSTALQIGGSTTNTDRYFTGQIDDVQIYNYALTATQVKNLYNGGAVRFGPLTGSP